MSSTMLDKALALAAAGYAVFPLQANSKKPVPGSRGFKDATLDPDVIRDWPGEYNIGIYPWACRPRLMVVDKDLKGNENGRITLEVLELAEGLLPDTLTVVTPGGGEHSYYAVPDDAPAVPSSVRRIGPGVDVRAEGGYVVAPGSVVDEKEYRVLGAADGVLPRVAEAPGWLLSRAAASPLDRSGQREDGVDLDAPVNVARALDWLRREAAAGRVGVRGAGSNQTTYKTAAVVRDFGVSEDTCLELLDTSGWNAACTPPRERHEPASIVAHVYTYARRGAGEARTASPAALDAAAQAAKSREAEPAEAPASRFRLLCWPDLMTMPAPTFMVAGTIVERSVVEIYGPYSSYKSFLAADMALSLATGIEWARRPAARSYRAVYVAGEGAYGIRARARSWADAHSLAAVPNFALLPTMPIFADDADLRSFADSVRDFKPELIVLDTAAHAMAGLDENAAKDAGIFMARCFELRDAFGCTVVLVHHSGKDVSKGSRGSSAMPAAVDTILRVEAPRPLEAIMTMEKQKDAEPWRDPQGFRGAITGGSLVFRPEAIMPNNTDQIEAKRLEALAAVLNRLPEDMTIETKPLAFEMAEVLNPTLDAAGREKLASAVRQWLNRSARDSTQAQPFVAQKAGKGEGATLWRKPKPVEET